MSVSIYKSYGKDQIEELLSNYLINSWSFSKISAFARHEKFFEMQYIFGIHSKRASSAIGGEAYHEALKGYFSCLKDGELLDLPALEQLAFAKIDDMPPNAWKIQKTTPTVEECKIKATKVVAAALKNFIAEKSIYEDEIKEILAVEVYCDEFVVINGVDIPLPCHAVIDVVLLTKDDKVIVVDHKSKDRFTDDEEAAFIIGTQAITYVKVYEEKTGRKVDEVWFVENKHSQNKDGSPQLKKIRVEMDDDARKLYEAMLYEPLRKMIDAVGDADYVYLINDSDSYVDRAEIYQFWARTMIAEVEDFNVDESKKALVSKRLKKIRDASLASISPKVIKNFTENAAKFIQYDLSNSDMTPSEKIEHVLRSFGIIVRVAHELSGYSSNSYLLEASAGVKIASVYRHRLDIANQLNVPDVRISQTLVMFQEKSYLAVEMSKKRTADLYWDAKELIGRKIPIGKDNFGNNVVWDLDNQSTPHAIICGQTGSGKSVAAISMLEYAKNVVEDVVIFDPKYAPEFLKYQNQFEVYNEIIAIEERMAQLVEQMNELARSGKTRRTLIIFDEFADALANSRKGKELDVYDMQQIGNYAPKKGPMGMMMEGAPKMKREKIGELASLETNLRVLAQKGRSVGFRIAALTQRASVKVITGDAKVNFPVQICFRVNTETDSRVVLDEAGAEALAGRGDGLIKSPEYPNIVRFQAFYKPD